ncbi:putative toxin-antitoxin system toxin component, PIN family [Desulforamulus hydrothermalis]|uniref:PilT protein domain protein n=1 Tax=Desulforamulus hydrothermalis Lam5 = DSM 18033 TaxID=1121428 RepID=K8EA35_9FIRM|nr:putative toxin-antitoxin system toxin component, PIN family [Desulforamulus hydrothermalis]CCO08448.1 PilT protein domain protein [Desulforamulus hydrothermalis Lam5 = DSM 18033]SHH51792.1 putative toxin-antitoxin system toxin component, PIN family [Desulforamulus hydrothermalis Lam5 = DSM 18033]
MRITVDTNVLISALGWNGAEAAVIEMVLDSSLVLCLSAQILSEFYRVVNYPKFGFTDEEIDGFIGRLLTNSIIVNPSQSINAVADDPDDNKIIECAVEGKAEYIISGDKHLLSLGEYKNVKILRASEFLQVLLANHEQEKYPSNNRHKS